MQARGSTKSTRPASARQDAFAKGRACREAAFPTAVIVKPVLKVLAIEQVAGVGKSWREAAGSLDHVPADMIDMQVGAEDEIDFLGRNASPLQFVEIAGGQSVERRFRAAITAIAAAGVDQHGEARRAHQERVGADQQPPGRRLDEFGAAPRALLFDSLGRRVADQPIAIGSEARQLRNLL
jgi:hypothetical protein